MTTSVVSVGPDFEVVADTRRPRTRIDSPARREAEEHERFSAAAQSRKSAVQRACRLAQRQLRQTAPATWNHS
jgi:hypothetical protein